MFQSWNQLTFLHWSYEPEIIQRLVPSPLEVDTFDGRAWVALTPFINENVRTPLVPAVPWLSRFPETNVRTYVRAPDGSRGVWFFSLEASRLAAVLAARSAYALPYQWARMRLARRGDTMHYSSSRRWPGPAGAATDVAVEIGRAFEPAELRDLDHFLTARWRLYARFGRGLGFAVVWHVPWPLHSARVVKLHQDLFQAAGLPAPRGEPLVHYSPGVDVRVSAPRLLNC